MALRMVLIQAVSPAALRPLHCLSAPQFHTAARGPQLKREAWYGHLPTFEWDIWAQDCDQSSVLVILNQGVGNFLCHGMRSPFNLTISHGLSRSQATAVSKRQPLVWVVPVHHPPRFFHPKLAVRRVTIPCSIAWKSGGTMVIVTFVACLPATCLC